MSTASGLCAAEVAEHRARDGGGQRAEGRRMRRQHRVLVAVQAILRYVPGSRPPPPPPLPVGAQLKVFMFIRKVVK